MYNHDERVWPRLLSQLFIAVMIFVLAAAFPGIAAPLSQNPVPTGDYAGALQVTPVAVFGKDNRRFLKRKKTSISKKIGLLYNRRSRTLCTAFCLDKSIIATAAHCLFTKAGRHRQRLRDFTFSIDHRLRSTTSYIEGAKINAADQHVLAGSTRLRVRPPIDATADWALVRLQRPVCRDGGLEVSQISVSELIKIAKTKKFFQVAFHRDLKKWQLAHSQSCVVGRQFGKFRWSVVKRDFSDSKNLILHKCDTGGASSGSPLIINTGSGPKIVGINVGTYIQSKILIRNGHVTKRYRSRTVANTGVSANAFRDLIDNLRKAKILTRNNEMRLLQIELRNRTLYAGAIDGAYGYLTRTAIKAFEKRKNWPVTGLPTERLLRHFQVQLPPPTEPLTTETTRIQTGGHSHSGSRLPN